MSRIIPKETIEQVRQSSDIIEVIQSYIPLKKAGATYKALCPFHKEKTPSFNVNPARQAFKCFGCGEGGDVFKFVSLYEHIEFPAAVRRLAEKSGIRIEEEESTPEQRRARSQRDRLFDLHAAVAVWWKKLLMRDEAGAPARSYLKEREINSELAGEFGLGFAPESWSATMDWAKGEGFDGEILELAGLVSTNERGRTYDRFRGRLMFPICDDVGRVVAFSGRLLDKDAKAAKYVNSPETPIFSKSRILYGLDKTKRAILDNHTAIVCEGQIDLMRCWERGIHNAVAPQGTAFTDHHGRLLKRYAEEVVLCFDSDSAGQNAAERSVDMLLAAGLHIRIATIPAGEDPDSLLRSGRQEEFEALLANAPDYTDHILEASCRQHDVSGPRGRGAVSEKMAAIVKRIGDPTRRHMFANKVAARLQIPLAVFLEEVQRIKTSSPQYHEDTPQSETQQQNEPPAEPIHPDATIRAMLDVLLKQPELVPIVQRQLHPEWIETLPGGGLLGKLLESHAADAWEDAHLFGNDCNRSEANLVFELLAKETPSPQELTLEEYAVSLVLELQNKRKRRRRQVLEQEIKSGLLEPEELLTKSKELLDIVRSYP